MFHISDDVCIDFDCSLAELVLSLTAEVGGLVVAMLV